MKLRRTYAAFTLIELLVVIGIIGLLAALVGPTLGNFRKGDAMLAATRTMLDGVARARQLAISQHTTVYMVFTPPMYWTDTAYVNGVRVDPTANDDRIAATNLVEKQFTGFNFVTLRSLADQPGQNAPHYLSGWQSLPDKAFIATNKFWYAKFPASYYTIITNQVILNGYDIYGFNVTTNIPFPREITKPYVTTPPRPYPSLPYIAFNYLGQLTTENLSPAPMQADEYIPLAHGGVGVSHDAVTKKPTFFAPDPKEDPPGNSTSSAYNVIHIDWLTGRARAERQQVR